MSDRKKFDRKRLRQIVEFYGGSLRAFEELRPDSYEQAMAAQSLEQLDLLYSEIFAPGLSLRKVRQTCPPWPSGSAHAGQQPKEKVLKGIFERFQTDRRTEEVFGLLSKGNQISELFQRGIKTLPPEQRTKELDALMTKMSQQVMMAVLDGIPVSAQLPPVDRLLTREKLAQTADVVKLKEQKLKLEERKQETLEKKIKKAGKDESKYGTVTKEAWEQLERDLKLA